MVTHSPSLSNLFKMKIDKYDTVIINLYKSDRLVQDVMGGNPLCNHSELSGDHCKFCGAFVGFIGHERSPIKSYTNINALCSTISAENIYIIHDRLVPIDFKQYASITKYNLKYYRSIIFCKDKIINVYSKSRPKDLYRWYHSDYINFLISLKKLGQVFWVNPTETEVQLNSDFMIIRR